MEATQMSIDRWMYKQNVVYTYNGILFSLKKEESSYICYNMDKSWKHYAKTKKSVTKDHIGYDFIYMKCIKEANL